MFINLTGISGGFQFGAQETDLVLVFTTKRGIEGIADGKLTLGVGASVAAGPVSPGRSSRRHQCRGVGFYSLARRVLGVALDGTAISIDTKSNRAFYGVHHALPSEIISGAITTDSENARRFLEHSPKAPANPPAQLLALPRRSAGRASRCPAVLAPPGPGPRVLRQQGGVRTFPMEDPAPGKEPPRYEGGRARAGAISAGRGGNSHSASGT